MRNEDDVGDAYDRWLDRGADLPGDVCDDRGNSGSALLLLAAASVVVAALLLLAWVAGFGACEMVEVPR